MSSDEDLSFNPFKALANYSLKEENTSSSPFGYKSGINNEGRVNFSIESFDDILSISGLGPLDSAVTANFWGNRHGGQPLPSPLPHENVGITFFTKPRMKLTDDNIFGNMLSLLANDDSRSMARAIRAFLDPYTGGSATTSATTLKGMGMQIYKSDLVDPLNPFITILGNNVVSMTGFPDSDLNTYTAPEGVFHETWSMVDDIVTLFGH